MAEIASAIDMPKGELLCGYEHQLLHCTHVPSHIGRPKGDLIGPVVPDGTGLFQVVAFANET
jgi:hypothetical protein